VAQGLLLQGNLPILPLAQAQAQAQV